MDGYSVQEAASVLGVAEGRVWELLARGVLLGTPEGDSMRVFLKAEPGPITAASPREETPRTNGNGGSHGPTTEASAFRELLTEFRGLTERYGQALLALGEARGEVAGLRSRVDQLEARLDLRLPPPIDAAPVAWDSLSVPASTREPEPATPPPTKAPRPARQAQRPRKVRSSREAVEGFADALARAQDPNPPDLAEGRDEPETAPDESTEPIIASAEEPQEPMAVADAAGTAEQVAADEVAADTDEVLSAVAGVEAPVEDLAVDEAATEASTAEVEPPTYSAVVVEPDWFADGDFAWLDAAEMEASPPSEPSEATPDAIEPEPDATAAEPDATAAEPEAMATEPEPDAVAAEPEATAAEPEPTAAEPEATAAEPEPSAMPEPEMLAEPLPEPEPTREPEPLPEFEAEADFAPWQPPAPSVPEAHPEPALADEPEPPTRNTAVAVDVVEEEVMWLGGDREPSSIMHDEPRQEQRAEAAGWPAVDIPPPVEVPRPPLAMTEDELARLALDEGWDEAEVAAIRAMITPPPTSRVDLPGAAELHLAMAALEAVPVQVDPSHDISRQWAKPAPDDDEPPHRDDWAFGAEPPPPPAPVIRPLPDVTSALRRAVADPNWLRRRQGPAAAAYRRLRRLFPG
jgi:hypothetical protein